MPIFHVGMIFSVHPWMLCDENSYVLEHMETQKRWVEVQARFDWALPAWLSDQSGVEVTKRDEMTADDPRKVKPKPVFFQGKGFANPHTP